MNKPASTSLQGSLLRLYARARRAGLLEARWTKWLFVQAYFAYKRYLEDSLGYLVTTRRDLLAGGYVLDIGANVGYTTVLFSRAVSPPYRVISFEPESSNFELLKLVITRRRLAERVVAEHVAVGRTSGITSLSVNYEHHADHRVLTDTLRNALGGGLRSEDVAMVSVDDYLEQRDLGPVSFVKMDVQGYEPEVCAGMERTLERNPDAVVVFEYSPDEARELGLDAEATPRFFTARGYRLYRLVRGQPLAPLNQPLTKTTACYFDAVASKRALL